MSCGDNGKTRILQLLAVILSGLAMGLIPLLGIVPAAGIVLFLFAATSITFYHKLYHYMVLAGILLLCCVFIEPSPSDVIFCAAIPLGLFTGVYKPRLQGKAIQAILFFVAYFIACLPGIAMAIDQNGAIRYYFISFYLFLTAAFICTYARRDNIVFLLRAYIISALISFLAGLVGYLGLFQQLLMVDAFRVRGLFKDPNVFGPFFVPAVILVIDDIKKKVLLKTPGWVHIAAIILLTLGIIFSFSRGAWVYLFVALFLYFMLSGKYRQFFRPKPMVISFFVLLVMVGLFFSPLVEKAGVSDFILQRAQLQDYDQNRFNSQKGGLQMVLQNPLGCGPGQFELQIEEITKYRLSAHSLYIRTAAENGVPGFICLFGGLGYILYQLFDLYVQGRQPKRNLPIPAGPPDTTSPAHLGALLSPAVLIPMLCGLLVNSLVVDTIHWRIFWFIIGLCLYKLTEKNR